MEFLDSEATAYDAWAPYYDCMDADRGPFIAFYASLLSQSTRSVLELGCGTGTVIGALADAAHAAGHPLDRAVGIDGSAGMLSVASARRNDIAWISGDLRAPPVADRFDLVFCCFNTLQHLLEDAHLARALRAARARLADSGRFAFDIYQPNLPYLRQPQSDRLARRVETDGRTLEIREDTRFEESRGLLHVHWRLVDAADRGAAPLAVSSYRLRQYSPGTIDRLLATTGFEIESRHGDLDRSKFDASSRKQVLVCRAAVASVDPD